jgi:hypothetical protein
LGRSQFQRLECHIESRLENDISDFANCTIGDLKPEQEFFAW